ncbi:MAG: tetratricopeptide (TPR) repeat protein [Lentimonas sp.]|jgi:tetratricopeptide (TPR) repeat protein
MSHEEKQLEEHLKKVIQSQQIDSNRPLSALELKELALSLGLTDKEWDKLLLKSQENLELALNHLSVENYTSAIECAREALAFNPHIKDGNSILARSLWLLGNETNNDQLLKDAGIYAAEELKRDPQDETALHVLSAVSNRFSEQIVVKKSFRLLGYIGAIGILMFAILYTCNSVDSRSEDSNSLDSLRNETFKRRVYLDDAYANRNQFILSTLNSCNETNCQNLKRRIEKSKAYYQEDDQKIVQYWSLVKNNIQLTDEQISEYDGYKNRLSIEKRKYNTKVLQYNETIDLEGAEDDYIKIELK